MEFHVAHRKDSIRGYKLRDQDSSVVSLAAGQQSIVQAILSKVCTHNG